MPKVPRRKRQTHLKSKSHPPAARDAFSPALVDDASTSKEPGRSNTATPEACSSTISVSSPTMDQSTLSSECQEASSSLGVVSPEPFLFRPIHDVYGRTSVTNSSDVFESDSSMSGILSPDPLSPTSSCPPTPLDVFRGRQSVEDPVVLTAEEKNTLLLSVQEKLTPFKGKQWLSLVDDDGIHVFMLSRTCEKCVQRRLFFACSGELVLSVHCKPVPADFLLKTLCPAEHLSFHNVDYFVQRIIDAMGCLRKYEICTGVTCEEYKGVWSTFSGGEIDKNPFQECRYSETIRSKNCCMLLPLRQWTCKECGKMCRPLKRRVETALKEEVHKNTRNLDLTDAQKTLKLESQKKQLCSIRRRLSRLREKMQVLLSKEGVVVDDKLSQDFNGILQSAHLSPEQCLFLQQQWKASSVKKASGKRWHPSMIRFALSIFMRSRSAYEAARDTGAIQLPSSRTLFDYTHVQPLTEGVDMSTVDTISNRVSNFSHNYQKYHILMCDEMYISKNLVFQKSTGNLVGYTHLTEVRKEMDAMQAFLEGRNEERSTPPLASKVLTFLVKGVASNVKEAVASFAVDQLSKEQLYCWTWEVINKLEVAGVAVIAVVMDGCSVNRAFIKMNAPVTVTETGVVFDTVNKAVPDRVVYFVADVPHLLKTIRNCFNKSTELKYVKENGKMLWKRCLQKNGQMILWKTIVRLYNERKDKALRQGFKLNAQNVFPNSYSCMKVKLAAQVLSQTVAHLLRKEGWRGTEETVIFIEKVNEFFDMLNGAHASQGKRTKNPNLEPYRSVDDARFGKLLAFLTYLEEWKNDAEAAATNATCNITLNASNVDAEDPENQSLLEGDEVEESPAGYRQLSQQTLEGIEMTVRAFSAAVNFLLQEGTQWINARIFCQDPLEQFFSKQRSKCGGSTNPNLGQFLNNQRSIHIQGQLGMKKESGRGNTEVCDEDMILTHEPLPKRKSLFSL